MIDIGKIVARFRREVNLKEELQAFRTVFNGPTARTYILPILLQYTGLYNPAPEHENLFAQGRAAGRRDVMLLIKHYASLEEKDLIDMLKSNPMKSGDRR